VTSQHIKWNLWRIIRRLVHNTHCWQHWSTLVGETHTAFVFRRRWQFDLLEYLARNL
jgi:hypothetical protein